MSRRTKFPTYGAAHKLAMLLNAYSDLKGRHYQVFVPERLKCNGPSTFIVKQMFINYAKQEARQIGIVTPGLLVFYDLEKVSYLIEA